MSQLEDITPPTDSEVRRLGRNYYFRCTAADSPDSVVLFSIARLYEARISPSGILRYLNPDRRGPTVWLRPADNFN